MARCAKKQINYEEEVMKIDNQIAKHLNTVAELKDKKSELLKQKKHYELMELNNYLNSKNLNIEDLLKQVKAV